MAKKVYYADEIKSADIAGVDITAISEAMLDIVNDIINSKIGEFIQTDSVVELHDIRRDRQKELILKNIPVLTVTTLKDGMNTDTDPVTVNSSYYVVDLASGIIQLTGVQKGASYDDSVPYFTKGFNTVEVTYNHGYAAVPDDVRGLANLILAKWAKIRDIQGTSGGLKSVSIGDYKESYDKSFMEVKTEFDEMIQILVKKLKHKYANLV